MLSYQQVRKGDEGSLDQQYFQQPQPDFLFGNLQTWKEYSAQGRYELFPRLYLHASLRAVSGETRVSAGMNYGL
jgi:hypothetical protein